ncbi:Transcriptional regulator PadR-like family protein [uncultured archaeon]|nr:Transcriptional regulator PadR-like family protein [uncultured archaeon]
MDCCDMKGFLSYLILWNLSKKSMTGAELSKELEKRKGSKPSPGTIYPTLKELKENGFIASDKNKAYSLTKKGKIELKKACNIFCKIFYDMHEMIKK